MSDHWTQRAACWGTDPELFFSDNKDGQAEAKKVCDRCPVRAACLADAYDTDLSIPYGVRGGLSANQRRKARDRNRTSAYRDERNAAIQATRALTGNGVPAHEIAALLGVDVRTVSRWRNQYQAAA